MQLYGSLTNRIDECRKPVTPEVGMGATVIMYSDRHAATIVRIRYIGSIAQRICVRKDRSIRTDAHGMSDCQSYRYELDPLAHVRTFSLRKNGRYVEEGSDMKNGTVLMVGERNTYHDYGF